MKKATYDIFISYRRKGGAPTAKHLRDILTAQGYSVFFDTDSLRSGAFNTELLNVIANCKDFILILSEGALDRCENEGDWVRLEIACALQHEKNIIPVMNTDFRFPDKLPEDIDPVRWRNGVVVNIDYFDAMVRKLISFLQSKPNKNGKLRWMIPVIAVVILLAAAAAIFLLRPGTTDTGNGNRAAVQEDKSAQTTVSVPNTTEVKTGSKPLIDEYREKADSGDAEAQYLLGEAYQEGSGVERSYENAAKYYRLAADQGHARAQQKLGYLYLYGWGVEKDYDEAVKYLQLSANQEDAEAQSNLAYMYSHGYGVPKSYEKALEYYQLSADQGYAWAQMCLGMMYEKGQGTEQSYEKAAEYYKLSADQGNSSAQEYLAILYEKGLGVEQSNEKAKEYYRKAAAHLVKSAQAALDRLEAEEAASKSAQTESSSGDSQPSVDEIRSRAAGGDAQAQFLMGEAYRTGDGVVLSYQQAAAYYELAAEQGNADAMVELGALYQAGLGVKGQSFAKAAEYFEMAVNLGSPRGQVNLAGLYYNGTGVEQSYEKAAEYYRLAADQNYYVGQINLAKMYEEGTGVEQDYEKAAEYYRMAADQESIVAKNALKRLKEEEKIR